MFRQTEETSDESNLAEHGARNPEGEREGGSESTRRQDLWEREL